MATINNLYIFVVDEDIDRSSKIPQHPVEKGLPITDNVRNEPKTLSISGKIVDTSQYKAETIISKLDALRTGGSLIDYKGRNVCGNFLIKSFNTSHPNTNWGGADFDMELVEVRIAKSAYDPSKQKQTVPTQANTLVLKVGAIVVFKGGSVYVSSDAKTAAATRGRSTCKITKIVTYSWSIHQYHLISTDGKMVYGWVDKANIEGAGNSTTVSTPTTTTKTPTTTKTETKQTTNAGTQQTKTAVDNALLGFTYVKTLVQAGSLSKKLNVGSKSYLDEHTKVVDNEKYYTSKDTYYPIANVKSQASRGGKTYYFPAGTTFYKKNK